MLIALHIIIQTALIVRVLLRAHRDPATRIAWIAIILAIPVLGIFAYMLFGEANIGSGWLARINRVRSNLPEIKKVPGYERACTAVNITERQNLLFRVGHSISGFEHVGGNSADLMVDSYNTIDKMIADINTAANHVHLIFYIWLPDKSGRKMADALVSATMRGVRCRVIVDDLGSRALINSSIWTEMKNAGISLARALPVGNPLIRVLKGRIDLRNHRKILVIDNTITYCGSQNCADPVFYPKKKFGPWVDTMMRFKGPIVRQNQFVFASDWMTWFEEDITDLLMQPIEVPKEGFAAQVIAAGPTARYSAMPEIFETLIYSACRELIITTPYYVPIESMQGALCAAANRGVDTSIIFPARNDDFAVAATSRSYYLDLLVAGVKIYEYDAGLLHAKTLTLDSEISLIGSANMDRRSFELNYENNILFCDKTATDQLHTRQQMFLSDCHQVSLENVTGWPWYYRLWNNSLTVIGPLL